MSAYLRLHTSLSAEPFYRNYIATDLGALFEEAGLVCDQKVLGSSTKARCCCAAVNSSSIALSRTQQCFDVESKCFLLLCY